MFLTAPLNPQCNHPSLRRRPGRARARGRGLSAGGAGRERQSPPQWEALPRRRRQQGHLPRQQAAHVAVGGAGLEALALAGAGVGAGAGAEAGAASPASRRTLRVENPPSTWRLRPPQAPRGPRAGRAAAKPPPPPPPPPSSSSHSSRACSRGLLRSRSRCLRRPLPVEESPQSGTSAQLRSSCGRRARLGWCAPPTPCASDHGRMIERLLVASASEMAVSWQDHRGCLRATAVRIELISHASLLLFSRWKIWICCSRQMGRNDRFSSSC